MTTPTSIQPSELPATVRGFLDEASYVASNRLEGDFPGGLADLYHRFALDGDLIAELVIAP